MRLGLLACSFAATMAAAGANGQVASPVAGPTPSIPVAQAVASPSNNSVLTAPVPSTAPDPKPCCMVLAGTPVEIEISETLTSRTAHPGDSYELKLARDLVMDDVVLVAAGAPGRGEVIDAGPGGLAGRPGKLILAARSIKAGDTRLPLRSFHMSGAGRDDSKAAGLVIVAVGVVGFAIQGGDVTFPVGTRAIAKVAADTFIAAPGQSLPTVSPVAADQTAPAKEKTP